MIIDRKNLDNEKVTEEGKNAYKNFYKDAERIDDRWNWYVLTIPFAAIAFSLQTSVSEDILVVITHIVSLASLSVACIFGILSQKELTNALKHHAMGCMFSTGLQTAKSETRNELTAEAETKIEWMEKGLNMLIDKEGESNKLMKKNKVIQYWATGIGLLFLFVQHVLSLEICQLCCKS